MAKMYKGLIAGLVDGSPGSLVGFLGWLTYSFMGYALTAAWVCVTYECVIGLIDSLMVLMDVVYGRGVWHRL